MGQVIATSTALTLAMAIVAVVLVFALLRFRDRLVRVDFREVMRGITDDSIAAALYFGLTFIGACLLMGLVLS